MTVAVSFLSILIAMGALGITALNRYWSPIYDHPVRITGPVSVFYEIQTPAQNGNEKTESDKSEPDTDANVHEN